MASSVGSMSSTTLCITTDFISFGSRILVLAQALELKFKQNKYGIWEVKATEFGIFEAGETPAIAFNNFQENFMVAWNAIALELDEFLSGDAQRLKTILLNTVKAQIDSEQG